MSDDMYEKIKPKKRGDQEELWYEIFFTLFSEALRPYSPYVSDEKTVCHFVNFVSFFISQGPDAAHLTYQSAGAALGGTALPDLTRAIVQEAYERFLGSVMQQPANFNKSALGNDKPWRVSQMPNAGPQFGPRLTSPLSLVRPTGFQYRADSGIGTESLLCPSTPNHAAVILPSHFGHRNAMQQPYLPQPPLGQPNIMQNSNFNQVDAGMLSHLAQNEPQMQTSGLNLPDSTNFDCSSTTLNHYQQLFQDF